MVLIVSTCCFVQVDIKVRIRLMKIVAGIAKVRFGFLAGPVILFMIWIVNQFILFLLINAV
jgi:hypothetical protein